MKWTCSAYLVDFSTVTSGLLLAEYSDIINKFNEAPKRSVETGFDCLEFHCTHNYLPHSMLSSGINHRSNEWRWEF